MRKLNFNDFMNFIQISDLFDVKNAIKNIPIKKNMTEKENEEIGKKVLMNMAMQVSTPEDRKRLFQCLSGPFEMTPEEVAELPLTDVFKDLDEVASLDEWKNLFISAQGKK